MRKVRTTIATGILFSVSSTLGFLLSAHIQPVPPAFALIEVCCPNIPNQEHGSFEGATSCKRTVSEPGLVCIYGADCDAGEHLEWLGEFPCNSPLLTGSGGIEACPRNVPGTVYHCVED